MIDKKEYDRGYKQAKIDYDHLTSIRGYYSKEEVIYELSYLCPYFPQFEDKKRHKYVVIKTSYGKGYEKGLENIMEGCYYENLEPEEKEES